jgi:hypothetical protein
MSVEKKLLNVQQGLKAPKGQYNSFGKYAYRNAEDILEAVKPLLAKEKLTLILTDTLENIGDRYYTKATARLIDTEIDAPDFNDYKLSQCIEVTAYAREEESKKGMDGSQVTGASSSYARKYALNGLFCIDDTKDSDTTNTIAPDKQDKQDKQPDAKQLTDAQVKRLYTLATKAGYTKEQVASQIKKVFGKDSVKDLIKVEYDAVCNGYENKAKEKQANE